MLQRCKPTKDIHHPQRFLGVTELSGLILAGASSEEDDVVYRLQGGSRYAMPLANRALVRYAADALVACGIEDIAIAVSPNTFDDVTEQVGDGDRFSARFRYLELGESDSALDTLVAAREVIGGERPMIVHSGDALVTAGLAGAVDDFNRTRPDVLLISEPSHSFPEATVVGSRSATRRSQFAGLDNVSPAAILAPQALRELAGFSADTDTIGGTVAALAEAGVNVVDRAFGGCWCYTGDCDHLLEANTMILDELPHTPAENDIPNVRIEGRVAIHPSARLERTTIRGPAVIGGEAELIDTFIGPYTSIGRGARLEGAEIDHSIVLSGAAVHHLGHRIEASVVGAGAHIARDFGMPTAIRLQVGRFSNVMLG
jgi:glucose-1-phosphate thymidylyltransferase